MNIAALTIAFNEPDYIVPCIRQFDGFGIPHLVLVSTHGWNGKFPMDETWALAKSAMRNGDVLTGCWTRPEEQYNFGVSYLQHDKFDWVILFDVDEFMTPWDLGLLIGDIRKCEKDCIRAPNMNVFWKSPDYRIIPHQQDNPVIALKTSTRFEYIRRPHIGTTFTETEAELWHMSYVRDNEQMRKKMLTSAHSDEFDFDNWYEKKWLEWTPRTEDLHPVVPNQFKEAIYSPVPEEIRRLLNA